MDYVKDETFSQGYDPESYVASIRNYRSIVKRLSSEAEVDQQLCDRFRSLVQAQAGRVRATVMTEDWCGDAACNIPILTQLCAEADVPLRVFRGSEHPDMKDGYEPEGSDHIPVFSLWDGSYNELVRWIEAPQVVDRKKEAWKAERPRFMELYAQRNDDPEAAKEFASMYRGFLEEMAGWYKDGDWQESVREICESLEKST